MYHVTGVGTRLHAIASDIRWRSRWYEIRCGVKFPSRCRYKVACSLVLDTSHDHPAILTTHTWQRCYIIPLWNGRTAGQLGTSRKHRNNLRTRSDNSITLMTEQDSLGWFSGAWGDYTSHWLDFWRRWNLYQRHLYCTGSQQRNTKKEMPKRPKPPYLRSHQFLHFQHQTSIFLAAYSGDLHGSGRTVHRDPRGFRKTLSLCVCGCTRPTEHGSAASGNAA